MARKKSIADDDILRAKEWLANGGTKKGACEILGVSNNKTMEAKVAEYDEGIERDKTLRAKKRREPVKREELVGLITDHLSGFSLQDLSSMYYRSTEVIKHHLEKNGAMIKHHGKIDPLSPPLLPEQCMADSFEVGQFVWSSKYGCIAKVMALFSNAYRVRVWGEGIMEYSYQPAYELGDLSHLEVLGVELGKLSPEVLSTEEIAFQINKTLLEANKKAKEKR